MIKLKLFVLALILLTGCSNTHIPFETLEEGNDVQEEILENEVVAPSEILKELEKEFQKNREEKEETPILEPQIKEEVKKEEIHPVETQSTEEKKEQKEKKVESKNPQITKSHIQDTIDRFVNLEILKNSNIGISIVNLKTGKNVGSYNENRAITPASIMKVITSSAAIEKLGAETKLETKLLYDGKIAQDGTLTGDLYIIGGGDPTLGSDGIKVEQTAFMKEWIEKIKAVGIKKVKGDIIVIDNLFGYVGVEEKWQLEDFGSSYGQGTYGISIFDNSYTLYLNSTDKKVNVMETKPVITDLKFDNRLKISSKGRRNFTVRGNTLENKRIISGEVPANSKITTKSDIPDPGLFLGQYLRNNLKLSNIKVEGKVKTSRTTSKRAKNPQTLVITKSVPVKEMVRVLLKRSDNHYTEHLYQLLKLRGVNVERFWKEKGIDVKALDMQDGSGLSRSNYVSAQILTDILLYMNKNYPEYKKMLPRGGYEGTVQNFLNPKVFSGEVRVKSGSMGGIQSYTGYVKKDGKEYVFTIIVNHWNGSRYNLKREMEKVIISLF